MSDKLTGLLRKKGKVTSPEELAFLAAAFRLEMFDVLHKRQTGHWGGASSATELLTTLYFNQLKVRPEEPGWEDRDRFILSKGHASVALYTVLAYRGFFPPKELPSFRTLGSFLQGHPNMKTVPGVDFSTGALGHGVSAASGFALAAGINRKNYNTYVMVGEGCLDEGQTWEAILFAAKYRPRGLVLMVDYNKVQLDGPSGDILPLEPLADKFSSFGWQLAPRAYNGHDAGDILASFDWLDSGDAGYSASPAPPPRVIIYDTVKGRGVSFMEDKSAWHGAPIDDANYAKGRPELEADMERKEAVI